MTAEDRARYDEARRKIELEFPPKPRTEELAPPDSVGGQLRAARLAKGMTWYAVAKAAGIPNSGTVRDVEAGRDAKLSNIEAIAEALGCRLMVTQE